MQHLQPNTTLQGGKYRIERVLGQGGFGITYLARNTVFDVDVAIKEFFMKDENNRDGSSVTMPNTTKQELFHGQKEKFKKEAKRMFAINNEHIISVHDLFEENGTAYYVMDYVDGENLAERLKRTGKPMTEAEVNQILPQVLDALKAIHDEGIWHLDLKPTNIMVDKTGKVKLIDFGASKHFNAQKGGATTSTAISYTNGYAPREQMEQNLNKIGPWTDIYALGATLYALLSNKKPPLPSDIEDDMSADKHLALPLPDSVSNEMKALVLMMLQPNRAFRPQSVSSLIEAEKARKGVQKGDNRTNPDMPNGKNDDGVDEGTIVIGNHPKEKVPVNTKTDSEGHVYVDLGLPSGTLWATCNIGASSPEGYGDYFAWGETKSKSTYNWGTYKWSNDSNNLTKYCGNNSYGIVDNKTKLNTADDAAYVNWGPAWRIPTEKQFEELLRNTNNTWTTLNGVSGMKFTSKTDSSIFIFLPAAGCRSDCSLNSVGSYGNYWSRALGASSEYVARRLYFNSGNIGASSSFRYFGRSIRPVRLPERASSPKNTRVHNQNHFSHNEK